MNRLRISSNTLKSDSEKLNELVKCIPDLMNELESAMATLDACWDGPAQEAYIATMAENMEILTDIYNGVSKYAINLAEAAKIYHNAEQDVMLKLKLIIVA